MPRLLKRYGDVRSTLPGEIYDFVRRYAGRFNEDLVGVRVAMGVPSHQADPTVEVGFSDDLPMPVGPVSHPGTVNRALRADARHQGVHSVRVIGADQLYGDVVFELGQGTQLVQDGQTIRLPNAGIVNRTVEYYQILEETPRDFELLYQPYGDVAVYFCGFRKLKWVHYTQENKIITFLNTFVDFVDDDAIVFDYFIAPDLS